MSRLRGQKAGADLSDWRTWPEWLRAEDQTKSLRTQADGAAAAHATATAVLDDLHAAIERAEVGGILGDVASGDAETLRGQLPEAEQAVAEASRRVVRFTAAVREMDARLEVLAKELQHQFATQWRTAYGAALRTAARKALDASEAQDESAKLWVVGAVHATPQTPGPLPPLRSGASVTGWLAAVRHYGVDV